MIKFIFSTNSKAYWNANATGTACKSLKETDHDVCDLLMLIKYISTTYITKRYTYAFLKHIPLCITKMHFIIRIYSIFRIFFFFFFFSNMRETSVNTKIPVHVIFSNHFCPSCKLCKIMLHQVLSNLKFLVQVFINKKE